MTVSVLLPIRHFGILCKITRIGAHKTVLHLITHALLYKMTEMHLSGGKIIRGGFFSEDSDLVSRTVFKRDNYLFVEKSQK